MDLVPVTREQQARGVVLLDTARRQLGGVRVSRVSDAPFERTLRAVGRVTVDESSLTDVTLKVDGWVTELFVAQTGQRVKRGQPLFRLYSPALFAAQQDFLVAQRGAMSAASAASGARPLEQSARQRLRLLGLGDATIQALVDGGAPAESVPFPSPASGHVIEKDVTLGAAVSAGQRLYRIAALDHVWVEADLYEADLAQVRVGQSARVTLDFVPGRGFDARVAQIYPYLDPAARTGRIRVELPNPELALRPGMYASVQLVTAPERRLQVPAGAVIYTGPRRLVFIAEGEGRFRPQVVRVGAESNGMIEVLDGLSAGDSVASSGVFLIAAEARISTAAKYWETSPVDTPEGLPTDATHPPPSPAPPPPAPGAAPIPAASAEPAPKRREPAPAPAHDAALVCPMHPEVRQSTAGRCPVCGMALVPEAPKEPR
jgi:Cu(I)/Ag(I) efflux system membrane fusion protein